MVCPIGRSSRDRWPRPERGDMRAGAKAEAVPMMRDNSAARVTWSGVRDPNIRQRAAAGRIVRITVVAQGPMIGMRTPAHWG